MADVGMFIPMLGVLALYIVPALLAVGHVLRHDQPPVWFVVFLCKPLGGPLLDLLWPRGSASRPLRR